MTRSSKSIALTLIGTGSVVLIGTALLGNGCDSGEEGEQARDENGQAVTHHRGGGFFFIPMPRLGGFGGGARGVASAPSARGGFGATGSAGVGS